MKILDLLGNKNRLEILKKLSKEPRYVTELSELLEIGRKAVIDHLRVLESSGLIEEFRSKGRRKYYRISDSFILRFVLSKNNSLIYFEDLDLDEKAKKRAVNEFEDIRKLQEKIVNETDSVRDILSVLREIETELEKIHVAERLLVKDLDLLIERSRKKINKKTENQLEKQILKEILRNGQISPEEISKRLKIQRNKVFDIIDNLRRKELI